MPEGDLLATTPEAVAGQNKEKEESKEAKSKVEAAAGGLLDLAEFEDAPLAKEGAAGVELTSNVAILAGKNGKKELLRRRKGYLNILLLYSSRSSFLVAA